MEPWIVAIVVALISAAAGIYGVHAQRTASNRIQATEVTAAQVEAKTSEIEIVVNQWQRINEARVAEINDLRAEVREVRLEVEACHAREAALRAEKDRLEFRIERLEASRGGT